MSDILLSRETAARVRVLTLNRPATEERVQRRPLRRGARRVGRRAWLTTAWRWSCWPARRGAFSAGQDLGEMACRPGTTTTMPHGFNSVRRRSSRPSPSRLIAAVDGVAVGVGLTMLLHCDIVLVGPSARLARTVREPRHRGRSRVDRAAPVAHRLAGNGRAAVPLVVGRRRRGRAARVWPGARPTPCSTPRSRWPTRSRQCRSCRWCPTRRRCSPPEPTRSPGARQTENATLGSLAGNAATREALTAFREKRKPDFTQL